MIVLPKPASFTESYFVHLIYALIGWIESNGFDPYLTVDTTAPGLKLPEHMFKDPIASLNMAGRAIRNLTITETEIAFNTRFSGKDFRVVVPIPATKILWANGSPETVGWPVPHLNTICHCKPVMDEQGEVRLVEEDKLPPPPPDTVVPTQTHAFSADAVQPSQSSAPVVPTASVSSMADFRARRKPSS
ncbi:hypothetical protein LUCX_196 [Xanthomonas phage vB_XciM_LucasX]|nr:hypothetical protein LUCX_196 [Xanthomonas phage vB_XciM_LucasX]